MNALNRIIKCIAVAVALVPLLVAAYTIATDDSVSCSENCNH